MTCRDDLRRALSTAGLAVEDALAALGEQPSLGDDGVAEAVVGAENALALATARIVARENA